MMHPFKFPESFQIVRGTSLKILGLVTSDAGAYQCIASNSVASVQASAQLQVRSKGNNKTYKALTRKMSNTFNLLSF